MFYKADRATVMEIVDRVCAADCLREDEQPGTTAEGAAKGLRKFFFDYHDMNGHFPVELSDDIRQSTGIDVLHQDIVTEEDGEFVVFFNSKGEKPKPIAAPPPGEAASSSYSLPDVGLAAPFPLSHRHSRPRASPLARPRPRCRRRRVSPLARPQPRLRVT